MKQQIEEALQCLIGLSFWGSGRVENLLTFQFGPRQTRIDRHGDAYQVGTYALHVQCAWRITNAQRIIAASGDRFTLEEVSEDVKDYEGKEYAWSKERVTHLDEQLVRFFRQCKQTPLFVQSIRADDFGGMTIELGSQHLLSIFPNDSFDDEFWRFFKLETDEPHFVVKGEGIEDEDDEDEDE